MKNFNDLVYKVTLACGIVIGVVGTVWLLMTIARVVLATLNTPAFSNSMIQSLVMVILVGIIAIVGVAVFVMTLMAEKKSRRIDRRR